MENNPYWKNGKREVTGLDYSERIDDGYREYKLDVEIAKRIIELKKTCTWRRLAMAVTGFECQKTGEDLERLARWTLGLD